ncbi:hypothetical protein V500_07902 [Pseudogymnoascus sp. VKM F-4518 (FW-2643)]|nr:hypothetical protein V500_07902 [Pseudogymnoascus sp. VKM F-4518 (FW-2643)]
MVSSRLRASAAAEQEFREIHAERIQATADEDDFVAESSGDNDGHHDYETDTITQFLKLGQTKCDVLCADNGGENTK